METANEQILSLEDACYRIMVAKDLREAKLIAAEAVHEDLDIYLEEDTMAEELDFDNDDNLPWDDIDVSHQD